MSNDNIENVPIKRALISLGLEGVFLSKESLNILRLFDKGKVSKEEALRRFHALH